MGLNKSEAQLGYAALHSPKQVTTHGHYRILGRVEAYVTLEAAACLPRTSFVLFIRNAVSGTGSHLVITA